MIRRELPRTPLIHAGRASDEPTAFIERASTPTERRVFATLGEVADGRVEVESPAVWISGEVVALATGHLAQNNSFKTISS